MFCLKSWWLHVLACHALLERAEGHANKDVRLRRTADVLAALLGTVAVDHQRRCLPHGGHLLLVHFATTGNSCALKQLTYRVALDLKPDCASPLLLSFLGPVIIIL